MTVPQILENFQESNHGGSYFSTVAGFANLMKAEAHHECFHENFPKFSEQTFRM